MPINLERKISVHYYHLSKLQNLDWEGGEFWITKTNKEYKKRLNKIVNRIIDAGYNVQILQHPDFCTTVFIDNGRFRQC